MTDNWILFECTYDFLSANVIAGRLNIDGVPAIINQCGMFPGTDLRWEVWVPMHLQHRGEWIYKTQDTTSRELDYLATGELGRDENDDDCDEASEAA